MSGHSKWATIKRQKGATDAKRSQIFTKLAKAIAIAARGGADPSMNFKLRLAIDRARDSSMPKDNIDRAIKRGSGTEDGAQIFEIIYEGYGPGGVAFIIETVTDNRNRTAHNIRHLLEKHGGRLGESGSVAYMFELKAVVVVPATNKHDELELSLIEAGAEDIKETEEDITIVGKPNSLEPIKLVISQNNLIPTYANVELTPKTTIETDKHTHAQLDTLREALEDDDDVTNTFDNES